MDDKTCTLCGKCLDSCPLFELTRREEISPKSKLFIFKLLEEGFFSKREIKSLVGICVGCGRCGVACPHNIDVSKIVWEFKDSIFYWKKWMWSKILKHLPVFFDLGKLVSGIYKNHFSFEWVSKELVVLKRLKKKIYRKVVLFSGCIARHMRREWMRKAKDILTLAGYEVIEYEFECCSYPYLSAGLMEEARSLQKGLVSAWRELNRPLISVFCATCYFTLKSIIKELFKDSRELELWNDSVCFLWDLFEVLDYEVNKNYLNNKKFGLHLPCHARGKVWQWFKEAINNVGIIDRCCGFGGFMILEDKKLVERFASRFWSGNMDVDGVITFCSGCVMQLNYKIPPGKRTYHLLDILEVGRFLPVFCKDEATQYVLNPGL